MKNFLRKDVKIFRLFEEIKNKEELSTTSINSFEILKSIPSISRIDKFKVIEFLSNFKIYHFDFKSSEKTAEIFENLKSTGKEIDLSDILIASIAIANNETFITNNVSHFERIKELKIKKVKNKNNIIYL